MLILEATVYLAVAGLGIGFLRFQHVAALAARPIRRLRLSPQECLREVRRIRWAILAVAGQVPWQALCFQQSLAAQLMLHRRGIHSVLYYGAAQDDCTGLFTHTWVRYGDEDVVGGEIANTFAVLAAFSSQNCETRESVGELGALLF